MARGKTLAGRLNKKSKYAENYKKRLRGIKK